MSRTIPTWERRCILDKRDRALNWKDLDESTKQVCVGNGDSVWGKVSNPWKSMYLEATYQFGHWHHRQ